MRKLQVWGFILLISTGNHWVESFHATKEPRGHNYWSKHCNSFSEELNCGLHPPLLIGKSRTNDHRFFSSLGDASASVSGLGGANALDNETEGGYDDDEVNDSHRDGMNEKENSDTFEAVEGSAIGKSSGRGNMQLTLQDYNSASNERWLEDATERIFDLLTVPLGSLTEDNVMSITGLMIAWSRRRSLEGALTVERLLKRVVDDMRAGNEEVQVSTKMYIVAMEAWGKSDEAAGAERAQSIHDAMIQTYQQTKNSLIQPSTKSYNTLILAWAKSKNPSALEAAEKTLRNMLTATNDTTRAIQPNAATIGTMLELYARTNSEGSIAKAETLVKAMSGLKVKKNSYVYSALQEVYLKSGRRDAPQKTMAVLKQMIKANSLGDTGARPNITNFNNVLCAYSRTPSKKYALQAVEMLNRIELPKSDAGYDVDPDRLSYFLAILTCSRFPNHTLGANLAEPLLERMEKRSNDEAKRREELSITAPPLITLDIECFNVVLTALSKSRDPDAVDRIFRILSRMEEYAKKGQENLGPTTRSMNAALNSLSNNVKNKGSIQRAEETLDRMFQMDASGLPDVKPNAFSYTAILRSYQRLGTHEAAKRGHIILSHMEELYEKGMLDEPPDTYHYTIVCSTWSLSRSKNAPQKCIEILSRMKQKNKEGWPRVTPNIRTYNAVLDCLSRSHQADRAEQLLYHMLSLAKNGDDNARPDAFSFNAVINAFIYSKMRDAGRRAESVLERGLEFAEEDGGEMLEMKSFTSILGYYGRQTKVMDSPYRAQYLLNRLISLFRAGFAQLSPHVSCFTNVMEAYAAQRHHDAGECSEEILKSMIKLQKRHNATNVEVNTGVMNCILNGWAECVGHDDAGGRAEQILDMMEEKTATGAQNMEPNYRSYNLVMKAWAKSKCASKADKALSVLNRAKDCYLRGKADNLPPEYAYSLVIHACAFSQNTGSKMEKRAFEIAVQVMDELMHDAPDNRPEPSSATYGWFFQVCARLRVSEELKTYHIRRVLSRCSEMGRINEFVQKNLKQCTSDALFTDLMIENSSKQQGPKQIGGSQKKNENRKSTM